MKKKIFRGVGTALITPFKNDRIDFDALEKLLKMQIDAGCDAVIIGGTTGESATLSDNERYDLFKFSRDITVGKIKLVLGTGTNDTKAVLQHTECAEKIGCDGLLIVTPYYNKGTVEGLKKHYELIAKSTALPIILYNVPGRTGVDLSIDTVRELSEIKNIVGIKEAKDSAERLVALSAIEELDLYAGNDSAFYTVLSLGGAGVISVISNLYPKKFAKICKLYFANKQRQALKIQQTMLPVLNSMFLETNPAPLKYAMAKKGLITEEIRLPLSFPSRDNQKKIDIELNRFEQSLEADDL